MKSPAQYVRKTFPVRAIRITSENIHEVAAWCGGVVKKDNRGQCIDIGRLTPRPKQAKAYIGHWILQTEKTTAAYTDKSFKNAFELP